MTTIRLPVSTSSSPSASDDVTTTTTTTTNTATSTTTTNHATAIDAVAVTGVYSGTGIRAITGAMTGASSTTEMKGKRRGDSLTKDDCYYSDSEENDNDSNNNTNHENSCTSFPKATQEQMKQRRIVRASVVRRPESLLSSSGAAVSGVQPDLAAHAHAHSGRTDDHVPLSAAGPVPAYTGGGHNSTLTTNTNNTNNTKNPFGSIHLVSEVPTKNLSVPITTTTVNNNDIKSQEETTTTTTTTTTTKAGATTVNHTAINANGPQPLQQPIFGQSVNFSGFGKVGSSMSSTLISTGTSTNFGGGSTGGFGSRNTITNTTTGTTSSSSRGFDTASLLPNINHGSTKPLLSFGGFGSTSLSSSSTSSSSFAFPTSATPFTFFNTGTAKPVSLDDSITNGIDPAAVATTGTSATSSSHDTVKSGEVVTTETENIINTATLPSEYDIISGEEDEIILFSKRCKTYRWNTTPSSLYTNTNTNNDSIATTTTSSSTAVVPEVSTNNVDSGPDAAAGTSKATAATSGSTRTTMTGAHDSVLPSVSSSVTVGVVGTVHGIGTGIHDNTNETTNYSWHEVGIGPLKLLQSKSSIITANNDTSNDDNNEESKSYHQKQQQQSVPKLRLVQRRESTQGGNATTVILNVRLMGDCCSNSTSCTSSSSNNTDNSTLSLTQQPKVIVEIVADKHVKLITPMPVPAITTTTTKNDDDDSKRVATASFTTKIQTGIYLFQFK
jgi:hypothetical protein